MSFRIKIESREINFSEAKEFAEFHKLWNCFETSAKTGEGIDDAFMEISQIIYKIHVANTIDNEEEPVVDLKIPKPGPPLWNCLC